MKVKIRSLLTEPLLGVADIETDASSTADSLIEIFCKGKGIAAKLTGLALYTSDHKPLSLGAILGSQGITDGTLLYLGQRRETDDIKLMMKWPIFAGVISILSLGGLIAVCLLYELTGGKIPFDYGIVMDAGSTHTQITLYKWEGQKDRGTGQVTQVDTCRVNGGIENFEDISQVGNSLLPCLGNISMSVPAAHHASTPLYLGATAGMRLLKLKNPVIADVIITLIKCTLLNTGFTVKSVGIIDGKDEGIFAWVTGNFLLQKLYVEEHKPYETVGALDMGGASTQISFEIASDDIVENATSKTLKLYGHNHVVFSESYLCFGSNEAMRRHHAMLVDNPVLANTTIPDPCGLKGDVVNYTSDALFNQPCTNAKNVNNTHKELCCDKKITYSFNGTGDNEGCVAAISNLLSYTKCQETYSECFIPPEEPLADVYYMAVSSYYYVAEYLNLTNSTLNEYEDKVKEYCKTPYSEALKLFYRDEVSYARYFCFEGHYIYQILTNGFKFNSTSWDNIKFVDKVGGADLGWSLGYMINATNAIPAEKPSSPYITLPTFIVLLVICVLLLIVTALFLIRIFARGSQYNYTSFPELS